MTLKELLTNNPAAADFPLYIDTENNYIKLIDCYEARIVGETNAVLICIPERKLDTVD